jgi:hypothetical protein
MRRLLLPALLLLAAACAAETRLYRSNDAGMLLQPIASYLRDQYDWVAEVRDEAGIVTRVLFRKGAETRRWEEAPTRDGTQRVEREWREGELSARRVYDTRGALLQEEAYQGGKLQEKTLFTYANGRLVRRRGLDADGSLAYSEDYEYARNGSLREVRRVGQPDAISSAGYMKGTEGLAEERVAAADTLYVTRYDARSRVVSRERRAGGLTAAREDFTFREGSDTLLSSREERPGDGVAVDRSYDQQGLLAGETVTDAKGGTRTIQYVRDDSGYLLLKSSRGPDGFEVWKYERDAAGAVIREEYSLRGSLMQVTEHGEGKLRTEEMYKGGELFLKVFWDGEVRLREEVYLDGKLLRERTY